MSSARASALDAVRLYLTEPAEARTLADLAEGQGRRERDWVTVGIAHRALGLIAGHLSDSDAAADHLSKAIRFALRGGDELSAAQSRADLAYVLSRQGRTSQALRQIAIARPVLTGKDAGRLLMMEALVLKVMGRRGDALNAYQQALPLVRRSGDRQVLAELLGNRGVIQLDLGELDKAERDLREAAVLFEQMGKGLHQAITLHNLGCISGTRGDVPDALSKFDAAEAAYSRHRDVPLELWRDRCELLISAGLAAEARAAAEQAVAIAVQRREPGELAEARVRLAQAALSEGDKPTAADESTAALRIFNRQRRPAWAAFARWVGIRARLLPPADVVTSAEVRRTQVRLDRAGFNVTANDARLLAAALAVTEQRTGFARRELAVISSQRASGPVWNRTQAWHAEAMLRVLNGDRPGVRRAALRGLALVADYRASLGATDLQAVAARRVEQLAELGLRAALLDGRPSTVFSWAERTRAAHLLTPPKPPDDPVLSHDLGELRQVLALRLEAVQAGRAVQPELVARQVALERAVRDRSRRSAPAGDPSSSKVSTSRHVAAELGDRVLVEYLNVDGGLHAVTIVDGRALLHDLGQLDTLRRDLDILPFLLRRLARPQSSSQSVQAALSALRQASLRVEAQLFGPFRNLVGDRPMVIVPTEPLQRLPWSVLPMLRGRPLSVTPSATSWERSTQPSDSDDGPVVLVSGPGLRYAEPEVAALALRYPQATVMRGQQATVGALIGALDGAGLVHIAAHGHFRDDNPMFSDIVVADGPLTVYDLEHVRRAPSRVVISACQSGRTASLPGGEVLGLASEMLRVGVRSVVASVVDIDDAETAGLMLDFHAGLAGHSPAAALAAAQVRAAGSEPGRIAVATGFVCFGAG
jgi:tetratricopeptide (TPR) repeat protein